MSLALNKPKLDNLADEIWKSAERLRGKFKAYEYQNVVLPIIVLGKRGRRPADCISGPTRVFQLQSLGHAPVLS